MNERENSQEGLKAILIDPACHALLRESADLNRRTLRGEVECAILAWVQQHREEDDGNRVAQSGSSSPL